MKNKAPLAKNCIYASDSNCASNKSNSTETDF